jgi:hypothetical protein
MAATGIREHGLRGSGADCDGRHRALPPAQQGRAQSIVGVDARNSSCDARPHVVVSNTIAGSTRCDVERVVPGPCSLACPLLGVVVGRAASASASQMRRSARHSTTIRPRTRRPCTPSPERRMTAMISSIVGGSAGYRFPLLRGGRSAWNSGSVAGERRRPAASRSSSDITPPQESDSARKVLLATSSASAAPPEQQPVVRRDPPSRLRQCCVIRSSAGRRGTVRPASLRGAR